MSTTGPAGGDAHRVRRVVQPMLERIAQALSHGEAAIVAACFSVPAIVLSEAGATCIHDRREIERFVERAIRDFQARGVVATRPQLLACQSFSPSLLAADVRWPVFDASGAQTSTEVSHFVLQIAESGEPRIRLALAHAA